MPIAQSLHTFQANVAQCDSLIASAHVQIGGGAFHFPERDREQITVAAFLNMFIAWEEFVEAALGDFMMGEPTITGNQPNRFVLPPTRDHSEKMIIHINRYFDYANHENVKLLSKLYFDSGYPFEIPFNSISQELCDLKTIRNACAHISSSTKIKLESLGLRLFGSPQPGISVYQLLMADVPNTNPTVSVYASFRDKLLTAAELVARG